jgi:hypothetical protein
MKKTNQEYKYKILDLINKLPHSEYKTVKQNLHKACGIAQSTFKSYLYLKTNDEKEIPGKVLVTIAKYLKVGIDDLFTSEIPTYTIADLQDLSQQKQTS